MLVLTASLAKIEDEVAKSAGESDVSMAALVEQSRRCVQSPASSLRCNSCLRTTANIVSISTSILLLSSILQRRRGHKRSSCSWRRSEAFKATGGGHLPTHLFVF